jgi:hypothetical protein
MNSVKRYTVIRPNLDYQTFKQEGDAIFFLKQQ